jgi:transmembrane sensor
MILLPEHIATILEKHLKGVPDSAEMEVLEHWRMEKEEHELLYQQLVKLWQESGVILEEPVYDTDKAWNKLDLALGHGKGSQRNNIRRMTRLLVAACLTGVLVLAGWMFFSKQDVTIVATNNKQLTLPDGSVIVLRNGATISFPKTFNERSVTLSGEAFFDVKQDKDHPFRIQTTRSTVEVLGTSFTMNSTSRYDRLVVATGKVAFTSKEGTERRIITYREAATLNDKGFDVTTVKDSNYLSWRTGILKFDNTPIDEVAAELSSYYNLYIQPDSAIMKYTITAKFDHQPVEEVLEEIKLFANISYRNQHDTILLFKP